MSLETSNLFIFVFFRVSECGWKQQSQVYLVYLKCQPWVQSVAQHCLAETGARAESHFNDSSCSGKQGGEAYCTAMTWLTKCALRTRSRKKKTKQRLRQLPTFSGSPKKRSGGCGGRQARLRQSSGAIEQSTQWSVFLSVLLFVRGKETRTRHLWERRKSDGDWFSPVGQGTRTERNRSLRAFDLNSSLVRRSLRQPTFGEALLFQMTILIFISECITHPKGAPLCVIGCLIFSLSRPFSFCSFLLCSIKSQIPTASSFKLHYMTAFFSRPSSSLIRKTNDLNFLPSYSHVVFDGEKLLPLRSFNRIVFLRPTCMYFGTHRCISRNNPWTDFLTAPRRLIRLQDQFVCGDDDILPGVAALMNAEANGFPSTHYGCVMHIAYFKNK